MNFPDTLIFKLNADKNYIYAATAAGLYRNVDKNWGKINFEKKVLPYTQALAISDKKIYVGLIRGRVFETNISEQLLYELSRIPLTDVKYLCYNENDKTLIAGTLSSVWFLHY